MIDDFKDLLATILEETEEDLPILSKKIANPVGNGSYDLSLALLADLLRRQGVCRYLVHRDIDKYRACHTEASRITLKMHKEFEAGGPIDESYVSILSYQELLYSLAGGDWSASHELAGAIGAWPKIDRHHVHPFDRAFGCALKSVIADDPDQERHISQFNEQISRKGNKDYAGYVYALDAIFKRDAQLFLEAMNNLASGHRKLTHRGRFFDTVHAKCISEWGLGVANLAKFKGLEFDYEHQLIPTELIVTRTT